MRQVVLIALLLVGCRQQATPLSNPFLGPDRVPAPATRTPPPGTAVPYYDGTSVPSSLPPSGAQRTPSGSLPFVQTGSEVGAVDAEPLAQPSLLAGPAADAGHWVALDSPSEQIAVPGDSQRERFAQLASGASVEISQSAQRGPRPFPDIADLPPVDSSSPRPVRQASVSQASGDRGLRAARDAFRARGDTSRPGFGEVQTASYEAPTVHSATPAESRPSPAAKTASSGRRRHGYAPDYAWLEGRLEYSQAAHQWRLRYIPIDGQTDDFGGSVILANPEVLGDLAAGDFVRGEGTLLEREQNPLSFAPLYRLNRLQPLAD